MHGLGIVHRDLKLENIMVLTESDNKGKEKVGVRIIDFGLAKTLAPSETTT